MTDRAWFVETEEQMTQQLAQLERFQQFMGVETFLDPVASAAERVYLEVVDREPETYEYLLPATMAALRPFCLIGSDPELVRGAASNALIYSGEILLLMEISKEQVGDRLGFRAREAEIIRWVKNQCGLIVRDLFTSWPVLNRSLELSWRSSKNEIAGDVPHCRFFMKFSYGPDE